MGVIYKITSPTGRLYVGQTKNYLKRLGDYKRCARYKYESTIINSIKKYGIEAHVFEVIEEVDDEFLSEREIFWINQFKTYWKDNAKGMNMTTGGECGSGGWLHDVGRREKQSQLFTKEGNPFFGKSHTKAFKKRKSKEVSRYNKENGIKVPEWGAEKGREVVRKPVICYNINGEFRKEFSCAANAATELNIEHTSISMVCSEKRTHVGGYIFRYKTENYPLKIEVGEIKYQTVSRPILRLNKNMKVVKEYPSAKEASEELRIPKPTINRAAQYNFLKPIRSGHIFIYKDLYAEIVKLVA